MSILVTGGAGFIGSHLCDELDRVEEEIICLDNFDPYYDPAVKRKNIKHNLNKKNFKLVEADIRDEIAMSKIFKENDIKKIVHLAAKAGVRPSLQDPLTYQEVNVRGTLILLELSSKYNIENFVFGSTSSIYGEANVPFREDMAVCPVSPYGATKLCGEGLVRTYSKLYGLPSCVLRFFTVYGPRQRPDMAIHKFTRLLECGEKIQMYGDGTSRRDYTYIDDIIYGLTSALNKKFKFEIINLGNSNPIELKELVSLIQAELDVEAKIEYLPKPTCEVSITYADISKARRLLDYDPKVKLKDGIKRFVRWYLDTRSA